MTDSLSGRLIRGLSGAITAGVIVLTLVVVGAHFLGDRWDFPGPGSTSITWHVATSVVVFVAQVVADRRRGGASLVASLAVFVVTAALLWTQWWD
ncbi:hypothetical protein [Antrihabitans stalactiti]|uniref:Uncharacterized protein n=1 Tax=Antrihabitans stalactiti TaxID=2584121 RepID=A0A848KIT9_9NOCA|nr:hypothetical protein [Antrihabitans stalactiti]NMN97726.1 hypothetical protein [Antrihabitans stalactiti]